MSLPAGTYRFAPFRRHRPSSPSTSVVINFTRPQRSTIHSGTARTKSLPRPGRRSTAPPFLLTTDRKLDRISRSASDVIAGGKEAELESGLERRRPSESRASPLVCVSRGDVPCAHRAPRSHAIANSTESSRDGR